jgi:hypothetical protein
VEINMKQGVAIAHFEPQYDAFLFASLGDDLSGMPLAVASLLGRMNLDPWHEAAALAGLPADVAAQKLATLIEAMPGQPLPHAEAATLAARLVTLLPSPRKSAAERRSSIAPAGALTNRGPLLYVLWFAILFILVLGAAFATPTPIPAQPVTDTPSVTSPGRPIS